MAIFFFKVTLSLPTAFKAYGDMVKRTPCLVLRLLMRNSTASPIFSDFQSDLSRVAVSPTAGQGEQRRLVRGLYCNRNFKFRQ